MSYFKKVKNQAKYNGTWTDLICSPDGILAVLTGHGWDNHEGNVFQLSTFFGDIADNADTLLMLQVGSNKDVHMMNIEADLEGTWELAIYEAPSYSAAGTECTPICSNRFTAGTSDATCTSTPTIVNTTVDAASASGQKVLNVTATTGFEVGHTVCIDDGEGNNNEYRVIDSIQTGVSLTMTENLGNSYTNETVHSFGLRIAYTHAEGGTIGKTSGSSANAGGNWIFKADEDYLFRMTNRNGAAARASNIIWWAEVDKQT